MKLFFLGAFIIGHVRYQFAFKLVLFLSHSLAPLEVCFLEVSGGHPPSFFDNALSMHGTGRDIGPD